MRNWIIKKLNGVTHTQYGNICAMYQELIDQYEEKLKNPLRGIVKIDFTKDMESDPTVVVQIRVNKKIILLARPEKREELFEVFANQMVDQLRHKYRRIVDDTKVRDNS